MAQTESSRFAAHLAGGAALGAAARREPVRGPGGAVAAPELRRSGGNTPRAARGALRFRGGFSGAAEIRHGRQRRASRQVLRIPPIAGPRAACRAVLFPQDIEPCGARGRSESGVGTSLRRSLDRTYGTLLPAARWACRERSPGRRLRARLSVGRMGIQAVAHGTLPRSRRARTSPPMRAPLRTTPACPA